MKKVFLAAVAIAFAASAGAQNKAIDELVAKYTDKEDFTVVNLDGDMIKTMGAAAASEIKVENVDVTKVLEGIRSMTIIVCESTDDEFAEEIKRVAADRDYTPMVSHISEGTNIKIITADLKGKGKKNKNDKEMVISVVDGDTNVLVRVIGNIDPETLSKLMEHMNKGK